MEANMALAFSLPIGLAIAALASALALGKAVSAAMEAIARQPEAAAKIHTDISKGFIKADIYKFYDLDRLGSEKAIQEAGLRRSVARYSVSASA